MFLFNGILTDLRNRAPYYGSDFRDALTYRVVPSTVYIFFTNLLPALAFALDLFERTDNMYGVNEVLLGLAMGGVVFGLFAGQPLCIVGVTGPICIFNYTVYDIVKLRGTPYFPFMCWICLWSMVMHFVMAATNLVNYLRLFTRFLCDVFGFFICVVYIIKGIEILGSQFDEPLLAQGYLSVTMALLMVLFGVGLSTFGSQTHYFKSGIRKFITDYSTPLAVVFFTGFAHFGNVEATPLKRLPILKLFHPTASGHVRPHGWFIHFWDIAVGDVFLALPFALLLTVLFYFDHNVLSLICQRSQYPLKKPSSFHWDFFLLGVTTGLAGILGIPAPNGLIPQAPLHTDSLCVHDKDGKVVAVVEQRVSNTAQGLLTIGMMSRPLLVVLHTVPQAVLLGLFFIMGILGLNGNPISHRMRYICMENRFTMLEYTHYYHPWFEEFSQVLPRWHMAYTVLELVWAAAEVGITQSKGAVGFPAVLVAGGVVAHYLYLVVPEDELRLLDGPAAEELVLANLRAGRSIESEEVSVEGELGKV